MIRGKPRTPEHAWRFLLGALGALAVCHLPAIALEAIPPDRAGKIEAAVPAKPRVAPARARRVLVWVTPPHLMPKDPHKGYNIPFAAHAVQALGRRTGAFEPVLGEDVAVFRPDALARFDAIVLCNASGPWIAPSDAAMAGMKDLGDRAAAEPILRKSLLDFVADGKGIFAFHYAVGGNKHWPAFRELLGASMNGHPWNEEVGIKVDEPGHPLVAAFDGKDFRIHEEIFQFGEPYSRESVRVLLSLDTATTNMGVKWIHRKDNDFALAWVKPHGRGRVFYTAIGHRTEHFWNPKILRFYLDGIQFATGDLEAPMEPVTK